MTLDYREWRPKGALRGIVLAYWSVRGDAASVPSPAILPDAHVELVLNIGDPVRLTGAGALLVQPPRAVVGLLTRAIGMRYGANVHTLGIRLHPARAADLLGVPAAALANTITPLVRLCKTLDERLARIIGRSAQIDSKDIEAALLERLRDARPPDELVVRAVDRLLAAERPLAIAALARELRISPRHLSRRFVEVVGTPPKLVERLARFARAWQSATMGPPLTWAELAAANGYADQAHLIREFRTFGAEPPAHLFTDEWYHTTSMVKVDDEKA